MAVTLTTIELGASLRISDGVANVVEPQLSVLNRILAAASAMVLAYAPNAPDAIHDEATSRLAGFLYDAPPGFSTRMSNPLQDSGAQALLARFRILRATPLTEDEV